MWKKSGGKCYYCGKKLFKHDWEADHKVPYADGGPTNLENCVAACRRCNRKKGTKSVAAFKRELEVEKRKH